MNSYTNLVVFIIQCDIICTNQTSSVHSEWLVQMVNDGFLLTDTVVQVNILWFLNAKCMELN